MSYLRPRSPFVDFNVLRKVTRLEDDGRAHVEFTELGTIRACISSTIQFEREKFSATIHDSAIRIIQRGGFKAEVGDLLTRLEKKYLIAEVEEPPDGWRIYWCAERFDLN